MQEVNDSLVSVNMDREKLSKQKKIQELEQKDFQLSRISSLRVLSQNLI